MFYDPNEFYDIAIIACQSPYQQYGDAGTTIIADVETTGILSKTSKTYSYTMADPTLLTFYKVVTINDNPDGITSSSGTVLSIPLFDSKLSCNYVPNLRPSNVYNVVFDDAVLYCKWNAQANVDSYELDITITDTLGSTLVLAPISVPIGQNYYSFDPRLPPTIPLTSISSIQVNVLAYQKGFKLVDIPTNTVVTPWCPIPISPKAIFVDVNSTTFNVVVDPYIYPLNIPETGLYPLYHLKITDNLNRVIKDSYSITNTIPVLKNIFKLNTVYNFLVSTYNTFEESLSTTYTFKWASHNCPTIKSITQNSIIR
jgi:hypothetical protein